MCLVSLSPQETVAWAAFAVHCARALERLLIVVVAFFCVRYSYLLAMRSADVMRLQGTETEVTSGKLRLKLEALVLPATSLPLAAACAFIALGLRPVETSWPVLTQQSTCDPTKPAAPSTTPPSVKPGNPPQSREDQSIGFGVIQQQGGLITSGFPSAREQVALSSACDRLRELATEQREAITPDAKASAAEDWRDGEREALENVATVYGASTARALSGNISTRVTRGSGDIARCPKWSDSKTCKNLVSAAKQFEGAIP